MKRSKKINCYLDNKTYDLNSLSLRTVAFESRLAFTKEYGMAIRLGRESCGDLASSEKREWLVTNSIGGYASGTVSGILTRRYHGLLVAALHPPLGRTLLVSKVDETIHYHQQSYSLASNRWTDGKVDPHGYHLLEQFRLEGSIPVWRYACGDALLEKRIWMQSGENTTYIRYDLIRATGSMGISLKALVNYRDHHGNTYGGNWRMQVDPVHRGLSIRAFPEAIPFYLYSFTDPAQLERIAIFGDWYLGYELSGERERGLDYREDHLHVGTVQTTLAPGGSLTLVASTETAPNLDGKLALQKRQRSDQELLRYWHGVPQVQPNPEWEQSSPQTSTPDWIQQLVLAADQFIVNRSQPMDPHGKTILAGYPWFSDWGRDTMIALPGLTLSTGRPTIARSILRTFGFYLDQGMLPNRFPDLGEEPEYNTVDAILWYFEALRAYTAATADLSLIRELYPALTEVIDWHCRGTRYRIQRDPHDGLLYAGEWGTQLTWMDAKIGDWVVTPRIGKPIEVNVLWIQALRTMAGFAEQLAKPYQEYLGMAEQAAQGFRRFWNAAKGYCYDVLDGPDGHDDSLRPNQILAVSLPDLPLLGFDQQQAVVDVCGQTLLTSYGLRSLAPSDLHYKGTYSGDPVQRDGVYHQGTVWGWLLGSYALAHLKVFQDPALAQSFLEPLSDHLQAAGVGTLSEIFDGDPPFIPRGCFAQAWTVAETLRAWQDIERFERVKSQP